MLFEEKCTVLYAYIYESYKWIICTLPQKLLVSNGWEAEIVCGIQACIQMFSQKISREGATCKTWHEWDNINMEIE